MNERTELLNLVGQLNPSFESRTTCQQIVFLGWFFQKVCSKETFTLEDLHHALNDLDIIPPQSFGHEDILRCPEIIEGKQIPRQIPPNKIVAIPTYRLKRIQYRLLDKQYSPIYETISTQSRTSTPIHSFLKALPSHIPNPDEQKYLQETLQCYECGALRAAIVMCWNLTYSHLCSSILKNQNLLATLNQELRTRYPKTIEIATLDDFSRYKESEIIDISYHKTHLLTKNQHKILVARLDRRNSVAHASSIVITIFNVDDYITDLVNNIVLALK